MDFDKSPFKQEIVRDIAEAQKYQTRLETFTRFQQAVESRMTGTQGSEEASGRPEVSLLLSDTEVNGFEYEAKLLVTKDEAEQYALVVELHAKDARSLVSRSRLATVGSPSTLYDLDIFGYDTGVTPDMTPFTEEAVDFVFELMNEAAFIAGYSSKITL